MSRQQPEHMDSEPWKILAERTGELAGQAAANWNDYAAGDIPVGEYNETRERHEAEVIEAWREYVHSIT